jgi:CubicO group peptidase (beta-lactamase class C family)
MRITKRQAGSTLIPLLLVICTFGGLSSCAQDEKPTEPSGGYRYQVPEQTGDGWETASLASVGMAEKPLVDLMDCLHETEGHNIHSLVIIKDGKLVFEEYFPGEKFNLGQYTGEMGFDRDDTHNLCSVTKSVTSALVGIAIDQGLIESVDAKVFDFFQEHADLLTDAPLKRDLTIEDLLTMRSGIDWDDETFPYDDPRNDLYQMFVSQHPIRYILSKDILVTPGTVFEYSNCNSNLLGEIVHRTAKKRLDLFSGDYLFSRIGVTDFQWQMVTSNMVFASGDLRLRPRDMAKFGLLFLNGGSWNGTQVILPEWVELSTRQHVDLDAGPADMGEDGYGYHWWRWDSICGVDYPAYMAQGWGGQWIVVSPQMNTVVVSTAGNYYTELLVPIQTILVNSIIPALRAVPPG